MILTPRRYQLEAREAVYAHLQQHEDNPCVEIPTAGGKSLIIAMLASDVVNTWSRRVVITAHVKELLEQNYNELIASDPSLALKTGIYSAGLNEKNPHMPITIAGIQSAYRRASAFGKVDLLIVDEAHLIPSDGDGMYRTFIAGLMQKNPQLRVVGFTATPYRMSSGLICHPTNILNKICYRAGVLDLMRQGYLCKLSTASVREPKMEGVRIVGGEFVASEAEQVMLKQDYTVVKACQDMHDWARDRRSTLVFTQGKEHAAKVVEVLREIVGPTEVGLVTSDTDDMERADLISLFKQQRLRYLVNINVLTTGFNAPNVDSIGVLRATMSPGLWYQICGRGFRLHEGKKDCLILDYGGNAIRHGPVDKIETFEQRIKRTRGEAPWKVCGFCGLVVPAGTKTCPECGEKWAPGMVGHEEEAGTTPVLSGQSVTKNFEVIETRYATHEKKIKDTMPPQFSRTMRVDYRLGDIGCVSEWICFEHQGFAREKAIMWWMRRSKAPVPSTVADAIMLCHTLAKTHAITVKETSGDKHPKVTGYRLDSRPELGQPQPAQQEVTL